LGRVWPWASAREMLLLCGRGGGTVASDVYEYLLERKDSESIADNDNGVWCTSGRVHTPKKKKKKKEKKKERIPIPVVIALCGCWGC